MSKRGLLAVLLIVGAAMPPRAEGQHPAQIAFANPQPHFVAAWAPNKEREAERAAVLVRRVSLELTDVPLDAALKALMNRAALRMTYSLAVLPEGRRVTISARDVAVVTALTEMLFRSGLDVVVDREGGVALVRCRHVASPTEPPDTGGTISGRVTDKANGLPIVGATISIDGTSRQGITNEDGRYRITRISAGTHLIHTRCIGYTPVTTSQSVAKGVETTIDVELERSVQRLEQVVVTGTMTPTAQRAIPTPIAVITADDIQQQNVQRIDELFRGQQVPGVFAWDQGTNDYYNTINVRGASSFSSNGVKTFIDGIEVADPAYVSNIDPSTIDRLELTRGPQASTLYGSDATGGVLQLFTKKGQFGLDRPQVAVKLALGILNNVALSGSTLRQDHSLSVMGGNRSSSYSVGGSYRHEGEWVASYRSTDWDLSGGGQIVQGPLTVSASARYSSKNWNPAWYTDLRSYTFFSQPLNENDRLKQQGYGTTLTYWVTPRWQHTLTIGYDQTRYDYYTDHPRFTTPADSFLNVFSSLSTKASGLYHNDLELRLGPTLSAVVVTGVNRTSFSLTSAFTADATRNAGGLDGLTFPSRSSSTNTGYFGQVRLDIGTSIFLTGGVRAERNDNFGADYGTAVAPRAGIAYVTSHGGTTIKLRGSYGESIRPPLPFQSTEIRSVFLNQLGNPELGPERQRGIDGGLDLQLGSRASLGVTYYAQTARDLIDFVLVDGSGTPPTYQYQNVGRIRNRGWEVEGRLDFGKVRLSSTYSVANSTVRELGPAYSGDYRIGDPVLSIPKMTAGGTVTVAPVPATKISASVSHAGTWTGVDLQAFYAYVFGGAPFRGSNRDYWMEYPAVTKFTIGVTQQLRPGVDAFARVDNAGNNRRFEVDNLTFPRGRVITLGAHLQY